MAIEDEFCTLSELADSMAAAVVAKYARPPGEVFTRRFGDNNEEEHIDVNENIRTVSRQNAVLEIFRLIEHGDIAVLNLSLMPIAQPVQYCDFDRRIIRREQAAQILQRTFGAPNDAATAPAPQPQAAAPAPVVNTEMTETQAQRQARRWQMCVDAGLKMPTDTYAYFPRGIGEIAKIEGIKRQALTQDLKAYRERLSGK